MRLILNRVSHSEQKLLGNIQFKSDYCVLID